MEIKKNKLNEKEIKNIIFNNYNISATHIEEVDRGTADIFKISTDKKTYILKQFTDGRTKKSVIKETNIINFLQEKNIKVPIYVKANTGYFYVEYRGRIVILQEFIDGYTIENNTGDYTKIIECANVLGNLTRALHGYTGLTENEIIEKSFSIKSLENGIKKMKDIQNNLKLDNPYRTQFFYDLEYKIKIANELIKNFDFEVINNMSIINAHGDFSVQQLIYNSQDTPTIIDFETAKKLPISWEIIRSYSYIDKTAENGTLDLNNLVEYFKEFEKYIKLNEYDLKYAPHIYLIQLIGSVFGYKQYEEDYKNKKILKFVNFRIGVCKYLYNNLENISEELCNKCL